MAFDHDKISEFIISILGFCRSVTVYLFVLFRHISRVIILRCGGLVADAAIFLFLRDFRLDHLTEDVVLILACYIFLGSPWSVFPCHLSPLVIIGLDGLGLPFRLAFFPALCLVLADVSIVIIGGKGLRLIGRKPLPVLVFSGNCVFFGGSAKVITFISCYSFDSISPTDGSACLGQGISFRICYGFCDVFA